MRFSLFAAMAVAALNGPELVEAIRLLEEKEETDTSLAENETEYAPPPAQGQTPPTSSSSSSSYGSQPPSQGGYPPSYPG